MGALRRVWVHGTGSLAWRLHPRNMLAAFSRTELGSSMDMFYAVEHTPRRELRKKYFRHALDEWRHARIFRERALALGPDAEGVAGREEAGSLVDLGIVREEPLFERLGEREFLAFVFVAEADAVEQFGVYKEHKLPDTATLAKMDGILHDEVFHVSYAEKELDRYSLVEPGFAKKAAAKIRWNRWKEGWLRASRDFGELVSSLWLGGLYLVLIGPFRLLARLESGGWQPPEKADGEAEGWRAWAERES